MIKLIIIIILIIVVIVILIKKKELYQPADQAVLNIASVYADASGTASFNNLRFTNKICDTHNNCIISGTSSFDISNNLKIHNNIDASGINTSKINATLYCNSGNCITIDNNGGILYNLPNSNSQHKIRLFTFESGGSGVKKELTDGQLPNFPISQWIVVSVGQLVSNGYAYINKDTNTWYGQSGGDYGTFMAIPINMVEFVSSNLSGTQYPTKVIPTPVIPDSPIGW
jgi:hypothetical protein